MANPVGATFVPGGFDDYYLPEVVAPSPQRVTPQVPQNMQEDLQRMELEAREVGAASHLDREPSLSHYMGRKPTDSPQPYPPHSQRPPSQPAVMQTPDDMRAYQHDDNKAPRFDDMKWDAPSFSPFPKVTGDGIPPADDEKEEILWKARKHVLHSQNVGMQISWARDVLIWAEIATEAAARDDNPRASTPRIEHELRVDAVNIIKYLAGQEHPDALYIRSKWLEFGKFGNRVDKREAFTGYRRAADLGNARSEYRMGMLFEQSNDMSKAKEHYYRGLSLKDSAALYRMGMMSLLGQHGETKDYPRGLERILAAADSADEDSPQGAYVYGMLVGRDLPDIQVPEGLLAQNLDTARMYIEKSAYLGFAKAQLKMGQAYELCQFGCDFNPAYSLHYYGLAARQGLPEAALGVSRWFLFGYEGVFKKNEELAFKYAHDAAVAKLPTGAFAMGYYHEIGIHVPKSINEARRWYQVAADQGNKDADSRLESLDQDRSLSKQDHETTTLTRIKSQHGSMRGKRPDRFKQPQQMPSVNEASTPSTPVEDRPPRASPHPSPGMRPTIVTEHNLPTPSRAAFGSVEASQSTQSLPLRPHSTAPYPEDDRPPPLNTNRSRSTAPYPEDDVRGPISPPMNAGMRPPHGPAADRPGSAFGIKTSGNGPRPIIPTSQSAGNLHPPQHPDPRGRIASSGHGLPPPAGMRQHSPTMNQFSREEVHGRPASAQPYPNHPIQAGRPPRQPMNQPNMGPGGPMPHGGIPPAGSDPNRDYGHRMGPARPVSELPPQQNHERFSRVPGAAGARMDRMPAGPGAPLQAPTPAGRPQNHSPGPAVGRVGTAPPAQMQRPEKRPSPAPTAASAASAPTPASAPAATKPSKTPAKGPATFEDMGIPQGKQDGDCIIISTWSETVRKGDAKALQRDRVREFKDKR
ncbi:Chitin synthase regulatory factor 4 [Paramyrothecium foliicola]|nr:Chitin synthase regulatory factor 4 [Paramyrothecium foliicola]